MNIRYCTSKSYHMITEGIHVYTYFRLSNAYIFAALIIVVKFFMYCMLFCIEYRGPLMR